MAIEQAIFRRAELLLGDEAMGRIAEKRVIIFGVGGVGFRCAISRCHWFTTQPASRGDCYEVASGS